MHNEATRREKLVRKVAERNNWKTERQREKEKEFENIFRWKQKAPSYYLVVGESQSLTHLGVRFGDLGTTETSLGDPPAPDIIGNMLYPLEYICICVAISHWGGWIWNNIYSFSFQFQC